MSDRSRIACSTTSHKAGIRHVRVEGMPHCDWVLIDAGDVIVHVFRPEVRAFYNLEKMWTRRSRARARAAELGRIFAARHDAVELRRCRSA